MTRHGFGLVELLVALTVLAVALVGLAGTAVYAHRSFVTAEAIEDGAAAAAAVLDSLVRVPAPVDSARRDGRVTLRWTITPDSSGADIRLAVDIADGARVQRLTFHAFRAAP
jgi:prepilin-type N-terminal cleavage/methylation domain-containing protein